LCLRDFFAACYEEERFVSMDDILNEEKGNNKK
jgi:hypothetical protein